MIYLIVGVDHDTLMPWHENVGARDVTTAKDIACEHARRQGVSLVVAAAVGPNCTVVAEPAAEPAALRAAEPALSPAAAPSRSRRTTAPTRRASTGVRRPAAATAPGG
jgi:hypothetical protein